MIALQQLLNGLTLGAVYTLVALAFSSTTYVGAAMAAHGLNFAELAAEDPVMSQRPGVKRMLLAAKKKAAKSEEEEEEDDDGDEKESTSSSLKEATEDLLADAVR